MASYEKLKSGKHSYVVRLPNRQRRRFTDELKRVAKRQAADFEAALQRGEAVHLRDRKTTVTAWHERWLAARTVEASTARKNDGAWRNHVQPQWGHWPIESITRLDVQTWVKGMGDRGIGPGAVHTAYQMLTVMLNDAVDHHLIAATPCRRISLPRVGRPEPRWLTRLEYDRLQLALAERTVVRGGRREVPDPHAPVYQALVGLGAFTGLRPSELAGLDVGGVDFDRRLVRVTQVVTQVPDGVGAGGKPRHTFVVRPYPKSARSVRSVPFPGEVADLLWPLIADRASGPLFTSPRGERVQMVGNFPKVWHEALRVAGVEPVRPYVLRHTFASWAVQAGVSDRKIMQYLGHADGHLIEVYAHLNPSEHEEIRSMWSSVSGPTVAPRAVGGSGLLGDMGRSGASAGEASGR